MGRGGSLELPPQFSARLMADLSEIRPELRPAILACAGAHVPPNVALMRLLIEASSPEEAESALITACRVLDSTALARLEAALELLRQNPGAFATIRAVMAEAQHDRATGSVDDAIANWSAVFDRLAGVQAEAGIALYALGSPELLEHATAEIVEALRGWGLLHPDSDILEIGCGIGRFVRALAPDVAQVTGLDVSREMIARARERCAGLPNVRLEVSSGRDFPGTSDRSVDLVLAADVFPYLVQAGGELAARHIREAARVLRPDGTLAILNYSYRSDIEADRRELAASAETSGFASVEEPEPAFRYWDGSVFLLRKAG
jgi:predicted TPR repeat methyltransferase